MEDKELLSAWEKIGELYGPQKRTYDEFKFQMQSGEYRKKVFNNLGDNAKSVWGYDNYDQFNADKYLPAPALEINDTPTTADNLPRFSASSNSFIDNSTEVSRNSMSNPKTMGGPGGSSRRISPATQAIIDANNEKKQSAKDLAKKQVKLERAKTAAATTSDLVTKNADFYDVVSNYSSVSGEDLLSSQLSYNNGELSGIEKGQFEQKAINFISEDMFAVVDDTENSQVWKDHGDEYGFLINQLNAQTKEIKILQDQLSVEQDPAKKQTIIDGINEIMSEGADYSKDTPTSTGVNNKQFRYNSYEDMQDRFGKLNSLPEFKNYQRAINVLGHIRDVSEDFESRNPEFVENQKNLKSAQQYVDIKEKYNIPTVGANIPKWAENGISKPILSSLAKAAVDIATLPRTLAFNDDYGWTDSLADSAERLLSKEYSPNMVAGLGQSSNKDRGLSERVAMVDGYQLVVNDKMFGSDYREAKNVRDKDGFLVQDPKIVKEVIDKYEKSQEFYSNKNSSEKFPTFDEKNLKNQEVPEEYKSEQQYNYETILPKFTGVMADLGILMFGTKGLGTAVKGTGALAKGVGMGKVGNYLSKSAVANRIGLTGAVTGQTHNGLYGEAIRQGMSPSEASSFALAGSLAVAAVAQINPQFYLIGEKRAATKLTERYIAYLAQGGKESKKTAFKYAMKEVFGAGKREMFEELAEIPALNAVRGGFNEFLTPDKQFEVEWSRGEIEESAIFGLAAGTATGPMNITNQSALQQQATYASYKAKDKFFSRMNDLVGKEYMDADTGKMLYYTQEQADAKKAEFTNLFKQLDAAKLSTNKLSEESEIRLLSLFQSGNNIKRLMDNAEGNPALMAVLEAQYSLTNDAIGQELESNKKQPKVDPKSDVKPKKPPTDGTGSAPIELTNEVESEMDSVLDNSPELELNGTVKPDPKVTEKTTEPELEDIANEAVEEGQKQQAITKYGAEVEVSSQENTEQKERYKDSQISISQQKFTVEDDNGNTVIVKVTTNLDGSRKIVQELEDGTFIGGETISKDNTLTGKDYVTKAYGDVKQTEEVDIKTVRNPKLDERMSDRQRKAAGIDVAPNPNTKVEGDQNNVNDSPIVPGHFTMLYNDAFGIKVGGPKMKGTTVELDKAVNKAMKESKTYQEALQKLKAVPETKTEPQKPTFTKDEITTAKATGDYLTPLIKRLKENFPGVEIVVDAKAVEELALKMKVSPEGAKRARGVFDATNNRVIINPETANKDTPIHEFAHVWTTLAKEERKELWDKGMSLIGDSDIVKKLREDIANDPDLQKVYTEEKILDEALAIAIGQRGAKIFESQEAQGIWDNWVKEFFDFIKDKFNIKSEGDIENLTLREFIELASTEILTGEKVVPVNSRIKLKKLIGNIEIKENPGGQLIMINTKTGKEVSKPTRRKIEKQILEMNELPADYIAAGLKLKEIIEDDAYDRGQFYDQVEASFVGYSVSKESFIEFSDANNINNSLARSWFKKGALPLDAIAQELTEIVFGNDYNANSEQITPQDLVDIMLRNPGNFLKVPDAVHDAKLEFLETTGISPTLKNAQTIASKQTDQLAKLDPVYDDYTDVPFQLSFQANFTDPKTGIKFTYDKNTEKFLALQDAGFITKDKSLSDFADKNIILHTPDFAFSGQISSDGDVLVEGKGGMYYPIKFHEDGYFWASTKDGAASLVTALNKSLKANGGKIYMGLVTATPTKLLSSVTAANGVVDIFMSDAFSNKLGITKGQLKRSLVNAANDSETITKNGKTTVNGLRADVRARANADETLKLIRNKLAADKSSFDDRKFFVQSFLDRIAKNINKSANSKTTQKKLLNFFKSSVGFKDMKSTGTKLSKANLSDAVSYMLGEPLLRGEANTNKIYAVLEIDGQVEETPSDAHESYPKAIKSKDGNKTKLHILKDRADWRDSVADPDTNTNIKVGEPRKKDGKPRSFVQILPPTAGMTYNPVRVLNTSENPGMSFQIEGDTNKKQISDAITKFKKLGKFTEGQIVEYFNKRFPDISKKELGEMYNGKVPEDSPRSEKRKYTSRLEQILSEETYEQISDEAKTYIPKRNNITEAEAQFMFENIGLEESIVIIKSNPDWLLPEVRIALTNKVVKALEVEARKLREAGKVAEANVISASINGIVEIISAEGTKAGRFIQAFKLLDALSSDRTVSLINKKLKEAGKDPLTKEQEAELRRLKEISENAAEGLPKSTAMANQYRFTAKLVGTNFKSLFEAYFYASILSGVPTQIKNVFANVMSISNELMITSIREAFMGNPKAIFHATEGLLKGLGKGWLNAKHILETCL